ncbi:hypothetical protein Trydic_g17997 [Trypoxylus dichotomus]
MIAKTSRTILRKPPHHCNPNPIEMIWAKIKKYVAANNKPFKFPELTFTRTKCTPMRVLLNKQHVYSLEFADDQDILAEHRDDIDCVFRRVREE